MASATPTKSIDLIGSILESCQKLEQRDLDLRQIVARASIKYPYLSAPCTLNLESPFPPCRILQHESLIDFRFDDMRKDALTLGLIKKIGSVYQQLMQSTLETSLKLDVHIHVRSQANQLMSSTFSCSLGRCSTSEIKSMLRLPDEMLDPAHLELVPIEGLRKSVLPKSLICDHLNKAPESLTEKEAKILTTEVVSKSLEIKKGPLSIEELLMALKLVNDTSWRNSSGICSGLSDTFNIFLLNMFKASGDIAPDHDILPLFKDSEEIALAPYIQTLPYVDWDDLIELKEGKLIRIEGLSTLVPKQWSQVERVLRRLYPHLTVFSQQEEDKAPYYDRLSKLSKKMGEILGLFGIEGYDPHKKMSLEKIDELGRSLLANPIRLLRDPSALTKLHVLSALLREAAPLKEKVSLINSMRIETLVLQISNMSKMHPSYGAKIGYDFKDRSGGHTVSIFVSTAKDRFIFFDSNSGLLSFSSLQELCDALILKLEDFKGIQAHFIY